MINPSEIKEHAEVIASCGTHVGTVDHMEGEDTIKLTRSDPTAGGEHHFIPLSWVDRIEGGKVILNKDSQEVMANWQKKA